MEVLQKYKDSASKSRIFFLVGLFLFFASSFLWALSTVRAANPPSMITYQGKLLSSANVPISTATNMTFVLYDAPTAGNALYTAGGTLGTPAAISVTPSSGIFSVNFGDTGTNPLSTEIFRDNGSVYLEITIGAEVLTPRKQITAAPYALNSLYLGGFGAKTVSSSAYIPVSDSQGNFQFNTISSTNIFVSGTSTFSSSTIASTTITTANIRDLNLSGTISGLTLPLGSISGTGVLAFLANNQSFTGLNAFSATTTFTTTTIASSTAGTANITDLRVNGTITLPNNSITDAMVQDTITASNYLALAGGTLTGSVAFGGNNITGLNSLSLSGTLTNTGLSILNGGFIAASSTVTSTFTVTGALNASSTLAVSGPASFVATSTFATAVGIATSSPLAALTIQDGSILAVGTVGGTPYEGAGTRLMWIPNKSAFRAGSVNAAQWDAANIGTNSAAFGFNNQVSADYGFAGGFGNTVSGGNGAFAFGRSNTVSGNFAAAFGNGNTAGDQGSFAGGFNNTVNGQYSFGYGQGNSVGGNWSGAFGESNTVNGSYSFAAGQSNAVAGNNSLAFGTSMVVNGSGSFGIGLGTGGTISRSNVLGILGGSVGIGTVDPGFKLSVSGTLGVSATSTFVTTTAASSTIESGNITSLFANTATITSLTVTNCTGCAGAGASLSADQTFIGLNTFAATTTLATTTVAGDIVPSINNLYDLGASSTRWRYLNVQSGVVVSNGVTTSTLDSSSLVLGQAAGSNQGKFYIDSNGNISSSGSIQFAGNLLPTTIPTYTAAAFVTRTLDASMSFSGEQIISLVVGTDKLPLVFYKDGGDFNFVKCADVTCATIATQNTLFGGDAGGNDVSAVVGSDGFPAVAIYDSFRQRINFYHCTNLDCSSRDIVSIGNSFVNFGGSYLSLAVGKDGLPAIAYYDDANADVRFIHCLDLSCNTRTDTGVDTSGSNVGQQVTLAIPTDGRPVMAYYNATNDSVVFARCGEPSCTVTSKIFITTLDTTGDPGRFISMTIGNDNFPVISYRESFFNRFLIFKCNAADCTSGSAAGQEVDSNVPFPGFYNSIKVGVDGRVITVYQSATTTFKLFAYTCGEANCNYGSTSTLLDGASATGYGNSLAIGADGLPIVAYYGNSKLNFLRCADIDCIATSTQVVSGGQNLGSAGAYFNNVFANQFLGKRFQVAAFDVAEDYPTSDPTLGAGDVVAFDPERPGYVRRAVAADEVIGIVSTEPGLLLSEWKNSSSGGFHVPVALSGRVPVKVNSSHGDIHVGDRLELSDTPGTAARATGKRTVAIAMDNFVSSTTGVITAFVNLDSGSSGNIYQGLTVNSTDHSITFGTSTEPYSVVLNGDLSVVDPSIVKVSFSTTTLLAANVQDFENAKAFILNAPNFAPTSTSDRILFSLRSNNTPVFSVAANGDVNTVGNYYGASATFGSSTNPGDLAERVDIASDDTAEAGDVMIVDPNSPDTYRRSSTSYDSAVAGVISSNPTIVVGKGKTDYTANLAMVGRVPVKVVNENGSIQRGDLLVASSRPGYAMKYDPTLDVSSKVVGIIGIALDPLTAEQGKIAALIRTGWVYSQTKTLTDLQATVDSLAGTNSENLSANVETMSVTSEEGRITLAKDLSLGGRALLAVGRVQGVNNAWEIDEQGNARVKKLTADQVVTKQLVITPNSDQSKTTIGQATINNGESSVRVENSLFTTSTKIFVTFVNNPKHFWWVSNKEAGAFTIMLDTPAEEDVAFDYWLVPTTPVDNLITPPSEAMPAPEAPSDFSKNADEDSGAVTSTVESMDSANFSTQNPEITSGPSPESTSTVLNVAASSTPADASASNP